MKREQVLMEALPYIQKFHGKTIVIKLGGHAMVDLRILEMAIRDAVLLRYVGMKVVLVHGGGPEITKKMKAMGKEPKFVAGLRITDRETLEIAQMVLVGKINDGIVSLIARCGAGNRPLGERWQPPDRPEDGGPAGEERGRDAGSGPGVRGRDSNRWTRRCFTPCWRRTTSRWLLPSPSTGRGTR